MKMDPDLIKKGKQCPYCGKDSVFVDSKEIYGKSYGMIYLCKPCDAYVGVHKNTDKALGRLANKELRGWKVQAHKSFDHLWKQKLFESRRKAYEWLEEQMGIKKPHIGEMDVEQCKEVIDLVLNYLYKIKQDYGNQDI